MPRPAAGGPVSCAMCVPGAARGEASRRGESGKCTVGGAGRCSAAPVRDSRVGARPARCALHAGDGRGGTTGIG